MIITVDSTIMVQNPTPELLQWCNENLVIDNPEYHKMLRMGKRAWNIPKKIVFYTYHDGRLLLPRGVLKDIWDMYPDMSLYRHRMNKCHPVEFRSEIQLRDYQKPAVAAVRAGKQGIIVMPCGAGKTETALQCISELQQPALWITHTTDLLNQSLSRAKSRLHLQPGEYGVIGGGKYTVGTHITFSTVQSLKNKDLDSLAWRFGTIVVDECHRAFMSGSKMSMFQDVLERLPALYRFGVTASEHRSDGLIQGMYHLLGRKLYEVPQEALNAAGNLIIPKVIAVPTRYRYEGDSTLEFSAMLCDIAGHTDRNRLIAKYIMADASGHSCLVLSDRLEQLELLWQFVRQRAPDCSMEYINGKTGRKARADAIERMKNGQSAILFATYTLAKEGLDIPCLDRLFLCTPHRDKVAIQQSVGRIMRRSRDKPDAIVYDFVDTSEGLCISQYKSRKTVYRKLGCSVFEENMKEYQVHLKGANNES